jgi:purine-cytosine permease-like protein
MIEKFGIDYIPEAERESRPRNLSVILVGGSLTFSVIILGWFPVSFGLSWWSSVTSIVVGSAAGALILAPMGLFGPRTGTNNPVASGAHFGVVGRLIGSFLEAAASLAFAAVSIWTGGDSLVSGLNKLFGLEESPWIRIVAYGVISVIVTTVSIYGHNTMVAAQRFMMPVAGGLLLVGVFVYAPEFDASYAGTEPYAFGSYWATWIASALIFCSTIASYGAYAGDWSRHIAWRPGIDRRVLLAMGLGSFVGLGLPFLWGAYTSTALFSSGAADASTGYVSALVTGAPTWYSVPIIIIGLAAGTSQAVINTYGTGLDTSSIFPRLNRVQATFLACVIATALVYLGTFYDALADSLSTFLVLLAVFSIPWIAVMTIGHIHRRGRYDPQDLQVFNRRQKGGRYWFSGGANLRALSTWGVAVVAGLLSTTNVWFTGPAAAWFGGLDLGFVVAGLIAVVMYPLVLRCFPEPPGVSVSVEESEEWLRVPDAAPAPVPDVGSSRSS